MPDLSSFEETSADDFAMEMGLACVVCRSVNVASLKLSLFCSCCALILSVVFILEIT